MSGNGDSPDPRNRAKFEQSVGPGKQYADDSERLADYALLSLGRAAALPVADHEGREEYLIAAQVNATLAVRDKLDELVSTMKVGIQQWWRFHQEAKVDERKKAAEQEPEQERQSA